MTHTHCSQSSFRRYFVALGFLVAAAALFSACGSAPSSQSASTSSPTVNSNTSATAKTGKTTKTGKITKLGDKWYLSQTGQEPLEIDSYTLDLSAYQGQTALVTGEYSGNTLFVTELR
jgi:hypothetical protein